MSGPVPTPVTYPVTYTHRGSLASAAGTNTALTGDGSLSVAGTLTSSGPTKVAVVTVTGTATVAATTNTLIVNSGGAATITLPSAVTVGAGHKINVVSVGAGAATVGAAAGNINGAATHALGAAYGKATYMSDGTNYFIVA